MTDLSGKAIDTAITGAEASRTIWHVNNAKISKAYSTAQGEMTEPKMNGVGYHKNRYATMSDIRKVTRHVAAKHGLSLCFSVDSNQNYIATMRHESGEWFSVTYPLQFTSDEKRMTAAHMTQQATLTYAERRCLLMIWGISGESEEGEGTPTDFKEEAKTDHKNTKKIVTLIDETF